MEPMLVATPAQTNVPSLRAIAPVWHTVAVLLILFGLSGLGARSHHMPSMGQTRGHVAGYLTVMAIEWILTAFIWLGIHRRGVSLRELIGGAWPGAGALLRDLGIAIAYPITANVVLTVLGRLLKVTPNVGVRSLFPNGNIEVALYVLLALTAGICEEIIFRGYLQRQFAALTRSAAAGLVLQGVTFGAAHGYQGTRYMCIIAVYGCLFGLLATWRRSLRPGMAAHFVQDTVGGLVGRHLLK